MDPQVGPNVLTEPGHGHGNTPRDWTLEWSGATARGTLQRLDGLDGPAGVAGRVLRLEVTALGAENWRVQCFQAGVDLQSGSLYQMAFWAKADRARNLSLNALVDKPDWHLVGLNASVALTPQWQKYVVPFTARHSLAGHTRISFLLGDALGTLDLAGMSLRRVAGSPVAHPQDPNGAVGLALGDFH